MSLEFDQIVIAINEHFKNGINCIIEIREQLLQYGIPIEKILLMNKEVWNDVKVEYPRVEFLKNLSADIYEFDIEGDIAECGVCYGEFALQINSIFPEKKLYLFDTFSSFDDRDFAQEIGNYSNAIESRDAISNIDPELVYLKMPHKKNVIIKQGYIPDTFAGLDKERFCFVNLDMDLYAPTLASLRFFSNRMVEGGIILDGVKRAVLEFAEERKFVKIPIGDKLSVAIKLL